MNEIQEKRIGDVDFCIVQQAEQYRDIIVQMNDGGLVFFFGWDSGRIETYRECIVALFFIKY